MNSVDIVETFVSICKASINITNNEGLTPLHFAAEWGNVDIARLLVKKYGADINVQDHDLRTPLHMATTRCHREIINLLQEFEPSDKS